MINVLLFPFDLILNEVEGVKQASISVLDFFLGTLQKPLSGK